MRLRASRLPAPSLAPETDLRWSSASARWCARFCKPPPWRCEMAQVAPRESLIGQPRPRIDGRLKVTGEAMYPSDVAVPNPAYAFLVTSSIAKGKIRELHLAAARAVPGVLDILTFQNTKG